MDLLSNRHISRACPKTGRQVNLFTEYPDPWGSLDDKISKADLECGKDCNFEPCPIVEQHNSIY